MYGEKAKEVAELAQRGFLARLALGHPHLETEVVSAARQEVAMAAPNVLARRTQEMVEAAERLEKGL